MLSRNPVVGEWKWGEHVLPRVSNYMYLGIDFTVMGPETCIAKRLL